MIRKPPSIKGKGGDGIPFVTPPSKVKIVVNEQVIGKCWLYTFGVDAGKEAIMSNVRVQEPGAKYCHFPRGEFYGYDSYYFNGLLSEKLELTQTKRGNSWAWVKIPGHERNEALDCRNYALGGFRIINPDMEAVERRLKSLPEQPRPKRAAAPQQRRTMIAKTRLFFRARQRRRTSWV